MSFQDLQDKLRLLIRERIKGGEFTGTALSYQVGIQQSHMSNYLNSRRGLSLESMDRILDRLDIGVLDLVDSAEIGRRTSPSMVATDFEEIVVVSAEWSLQPGGFSSDQIRETVNYKKAYLRKLKPNDVCHRSHWLRFVVIRLDPRTARTMYEPEARGATLLIDRQYTSLDAYRQRRPNLYAVLLQSHFAIGYLSISGQDLILRPRNPLLPIELARIDRPTGYAHYVIGRVCHVAIEV